jgi:hypothetical protein
MCYVGSCSIRSESEISNLTSIWKGACRVLARHGRFRSHPSVSRDAASESTDMSLTLLTSCSCACSCSDDADNVLPPRAMRASSSSAGVGRPESFAIEAGSTSFDRSDQNRLLA